MEELCYICSQSSTYCVSHPVYQYVEDKQLTPIDQLGSIGSPEVCSICGQSSTYCVGHLLGKRTSRMRYVVPSRVSKVKEAV